MRLGDVIDDLEALGGDLTIYAANRPDWTPESRAVVARAPADGSTPPEAAGLTYFLEVELAQEAVEVWSEWRDGARPTSDDRFRAVTHYARFDAYLPEDEPA